MLLFYKYLNIVVVRLLEWRFVVCGILIEEDIVLLVIFFFMDKILF